MRNVFCYKCGRQIDDDAQFCRYCGAKMNVIPADASAAPAVENKAAENQPTINPNKKKSSGWIIFGILGGVVIIAALVLVFWDNQATLSSPDFGEVISSSDPTDSTAGTLTKPEDSEVDKTIDATQKPESSEKEDVDIETIHISMDNMRPTILETSTIKVRFNKFGYANNKTVFDVNFIVENETDEEISVVWTDVTVNGYDVPTSTGKTIVEPGHKANCESSVWQDEIDETGESKWNVIEGVIEIRKSYLGDVLYSVPVTIDKACWEYEEEYAKDNPITPIVSSDLAEVPEDAIVISADNLYPILVAEEGVTATVSGYGYANGKTVFDINFAMENNTDEDLSIVLTDVVVDGYDISTSTGKTLVEAGHKAVCDSSVWLRDMEEVGINDWIVLKGTVEIRGDYWGDAVYSIPVVIYRNAWTSVD